MDMHEILIAGSLAGSGGGSGGGGVSDYAGLTGKPKINGTTLNGNKTAEQLGLQSALTFDNVPTSESTNPVKSSGVFTALAGKVDKVAGKGLSTNDYTTVEKTKLAGIESGAEQNVIAHITVNGTEIVPVDKTVALNVLTNTADNLTNYYKKTETYTQTEVNELLANISTLTLDIVETLPESDISTTTIYLVPASAGANVYMQYAYINNAWAQLGTTQIDLTNYYTKAQTDTLLDEKQDELTFDTAPTANSENPVTSGGLYTALAGKQNTLTLDTVPTASSTNPVTSDGIFTALAGKQDTLSFDLAPTENSTNSLTSGAVYTALSGKQDTLTFDTEPTAGSENPVTSGGIASALENVGSQFIGTTAEWNALTTAEKAKYEVVNLTDDHSVSDGWQEYVRNQNILSDYESFTANSSNKLTCSYDGILSFRGYNSSWSGMAGNVYVNGEGYQYYYTGHGGEIQVIVQKGDVVYATGDLTSGKARWYKLRDYKGR